MGEKPLPAGACLKYAGGPEALLCDSSWKELGRVAIDTAASRVGTGSHSIEAGCEKTPGAELKIELHLFGKPTRVTAPGQS